MWCHCWNDVGASTANVSAQARSAAVWRDSGVSAPRAARAVPRMSRTVLWCTSSRVAISLTFTPTASSAARAAQSRGIA
jgi:hypothetical protein